jgi:hypothetical protein
MSMKNNSMTPSGIEPATFLLVAEWLALRYTVKLTRVEAHERVVLQYWNERRFCSK